MAWNEQCLKVPHSLPVIGISKAHLQISRVTGLPKSGGSPPGDSAVAILRVDSVLWWQTDRDNSLAKGDPAAP